jgi:hypothetical protein
MAHQAASREVLIESKVMASDYQYSSAELSSLEVIRKNNEETWKVLQEGGFDATKPVDLDFWCDGRSKRFICALAVLLETDFGYETAVSVTDYMNGDAVVSIYRIQGKRRRVLINPEYIDGWCDFMVRICHDWGCEFDGWGVFHRGSESSKPE